MIGKGEEMMNLNECWNSVDLYGSAAAIARFRRLCIDAQTDDPEDLMESDEGPDVTIGLKDVLAAEHCRTVPGAPKVHAWNYHESTPNHGQWWFAFDTSIDFPERIFEELASMFPDLAFACECIDSSDKFMGYGWFNGPPGGEAFHQSFAVPKDHWTGSCIKRNAESEAKHVAHVETLIKAAQLADGGARET